MTFGLIRDLAPRKPKSEAEHNGDLRRIARDVCKNLSGGNARLQQGLCLTSEDVKELREDAK